MSENTFMAMQLMSNIYCPIQRTGILGYSTDQYYRKYPRLKTQIPVLVLHGMENMNCIIKNLGFL